MIDYACKCEVGSKRDINQDSIAAFSKDDVGLFVVADGMGGHLEGEKASQQITRDMTEWWDGFSREKYGNNFQRMVESIKVSLEKANMTIYEEYNQKGICGSTVVVLFVFGSAYAVINVGDSRGYLSSGYFDWKQITYDDVWENQPGLPLSDKNNKKHPDRGKLITAIGTKNFVRCHITTDDIKPGTKFLLCSDGIYRFCSEKKLKHFVRKVKRNSIVTTCENIKDIVYKNGAKDNLSLIIVMVS